MAAGMGSRFGGLKQITPVDDRGQLLIDYAMYDARLAGFEDIVFIIKHSIEQDFMSVVGDRMKKQLNVSIVFQELEKLPPGYSVPEGRIKPWGTSHAILCAKDVLDSPFAIVNADDFYGRDAIVKIYDFLENQTDTAAHAMIGYSLESTVTSSGFVARGECHVENGFLTHITERSKIRKCDGGAEYTEDGEVFTFLPGSTIVSMNLWGFGTSVFSSLESGFERFLDTTAKENPLKSEYFLPSGVQEMINNGDGSIAVIPTTGKWHGVTYADDLIPVKAEMKKLVDSGEYPERLWE